MDVEQYFHGHVALVTGAGVRIGRALVLALAGSGATVAVHYNHSSTEAERVVEEITRAGGRAGTVQADLADDAECSDLIRRVNRELGLVRILVNSASLFGTGTFQSTTLGEWEENLNVNLRAPFRLSQSFAAQDDGRIEGNILNLSDWRGVRPGVDHFAYTVSKAALIKMTESMALALAPRIRVNCIALGSILLPAGAPREMETELAHAAPLNRMGGVEDVVAAALYLLGPAGFVTGETLTVDGGRRLVT